MKKKENKFKALEFMREARRKMTEKYLADPEKYLADLEGERLIILL